jgi:hypothetical protein
MATRTKDRYTAGNYSGGGAANGGYGLGFIGALVYWIQQADDFGEGLVGVLKAIVWPAFLVYDALDFLGA